MPECKFKNFIHYAMFILLRHILKKMNQNLPLNWAISDVFLPDVCQLRSYHIGKYVHASEREIIFWANYNKFAVEFGLKIRIPKNVRNLDLFWKNLWFFWKKKTWIFWKLLKVANLLSNAYQMVLFQTNIISTLIMEFFQQKVRKLRKWEKLENMMKWQWFFKKKIFIFSKAFCTKMGGANDAAGSRPSCSSFLWKLIVPTKISTNLITLNRNEKN